MAKRRPNGDGMIRQLDSGLREGRIVVGHKKDGSPIFRYAYGRNQKEFMQNLLDLKNRYRDVHLTEESNMNLSDWIEKWLTEYMPERVRASTLSGYAQDLNTYVKPRLGHKKLSRITTNDIQKMYTELKTNGRIKEHPVHGYALADNTIIRIHTTLHGAMETATQLHLIPSNPVIGTKVPKRRKKKLQVLNDTQLDRLMKAIESDEEWGDFFLLELTTGPRRGEICGFKWDDFDEESNRLKINRSISYRKGGELYEDKPKTEESERTLTLPEMTAEMLKRRKRISQWIFPNPLNPDKPVSPAAAYRRAKKLLKKAGLPNISFHDLRHTFATVAVANGVDAKTLASILGHTNPSFSLDTYTHVTTDMQQRASEIVGDFIEDILGEELIL